MRLRGVLAGSLALVALQVATSSDRAAGRVGDMLSGVAGLVRLLLDPSTPAIPDLTGTGDKPAAAPAATTPLDDPAPRLPAVVDV